MKITSWSFTVIRCIIYSISYELVEITDAHYTITYPVSTIMCMYKFSRTKSNTHFDGHPAQMRDTARCVVIILRLVKTRTHHYGERTENRETLVMKNARAESWNEKHCDAVFFCTITCCTWKQDACGLLLFRFFCGHETRRRRRYHASERNYTTVVIAAAAAIKWSNSRGRLRLTAFNDRKAIFLYYRAAIGSA